MFCPVDSGICGLKPGESEDDIFTAAFHDAKEMPLGYPFNVGIKGAGIADSTSFVYCLINISNGNGRGEFLGGETVFSDELPVNAGDISTGVYQCRGIDDFEGV